MIKFIYIFFKQLFVYIANFCFNLTGATEEKFFFEKKSPQPSRIQRLNSIPCQCDKTPEMTNANDDENSKNNAGEEIVKEILKDVIEKVMNLSTKSSSNQQDEQQVSNESSNTTVSKKTK